MTTQQADHPIRKVKIKVWRLRNKIYLIKNEAREASAECWGGWRNVTEEIQEAIKA